MFDVDFTAMKSGQNRRAVPESMNGNSETAVRTLSVSCLKERMVKSEREMDGTGNDSISARLVVDVLSGRVTPNAMAKHWQMNCFGQCSTPV